MIMPTVAFKQAKVKGRYFESLMRRELLVMGFEVLDSDHLKYRDKKGWDCEVRIKGERCKVEFKYDEASEITGNVCVELASLRQSIAPIWIYGLPEGNQIYTYAVYLADLAPYVLRWPITRLGGEFATPLALIPKSTFLRQPFIKKLKVINK